MTLRLATSQDWLADLQFESGKGLSINYVMPKLAIFDPPPPHVTLLVKILINFNKRKMQLDVGMEPTFRFEHMICICKEMGIVKFEILWKFTCRVEIIFLECSHLSRLNLLNFTKNYLLSGNIFFTV